MGKKGLENYQLEDEKMPEEKRMTLQDLLNYETDEYLKPDEIALIKSTLKNNPKLISVLRKVLLPVIGDAEMPIEEMGTDIWLTGVDWTQVPVDQVKPLIMGRQLAIKFVMGGLIKLKVLANVKEESPAERTLRTKKDSVK